MAKRRGWGWKNKYGFLALEVNGEVTRVYGNYGDEKKTSTSDMYGFALGTSMELPDGSVYKYSTAGETIGAGELCMQAAGVGNHDMDLVTPAIVAIGSSTITVTLGATEATANQYKDGYIYVNDADGEGHIYRIKSNPAADSGANLTVTLANGETVAEALSTSSLTGLMANAYSAVELWDVNDIDGIPVGVAATEIASGSYGWLQAWGYAACLSGATVPVLGSAVMPADTAADDGSVEVRDPATATPSIGYAALIAPVDLDSGVIFLTISR